MTEYDYPLYATDAEYGKGPYTVCHKRRDCHNLQRATTEIHTIENGEIDEDSIRLARCCNPVDYAKLEL